MSRKTSDDAKAPPHPDDWGPRSFDKTGFSTYRLSLDRGGIVLKLSHLRRDRHELIGELRVECQFAGARTIDGILHIADFNLSSAQARSTRAKILASRALTGDVDWEGLLQELCQRTLDAERVGDDAVVLKDVEVQDEDHSVFEILGLHIPRRHPTIWFGDGGAAKSLFALYLSCELAVNGELIMYCDWEADAQTHRQRLAKLHPQNAPPFLYVRCDRPLVECADRLRALAADNGITYMILDSAAYGCQGAPESAEAALDYFRALGSIGGVGKFIIAHMNKSEDGDRKPFGSSFWHNSARATFHVRRSNADDASDIFTLVTPRKCNNGKLGLAMPFRVEFGHRIQFRRDSVLSAEEFAPHIELSQRIFATLRRGAMTRDDLVIAFPDQKPETIKRTVNRALSRGSLIVFPSPDGERIGLKA